MTDMSEKNEFVSVERLQRTNSPRRVIEGLKNELLKAELTFEEMFACMKTWPAFEDQLVELFYWGEKDLELINGFLAAGADINTQNEKGHSVLHVLAQYAPRRLEFLSFILKKGANVNLLDKDGEPPLHLAVRHAHLEIAKILLEAGADINITNSKKLSVLHLAVHAHANLKMIDLLLKNKANPLLRDYQDETAAEVAKNAGNFTLAEIFDEAAMNWRAEAKRNLESGGES